MGALYTVIRMSQLADGMGTSVERRSLAPQPDGRNVPGVIRSVLGAPLLGKLAGANALVAIVAFAVTVSLHGLHGGRGVLALIMLGTLLATLVVNLVLVSVALRPIRRLEETAARVWKGDLDARVPPSLVADRDMDRVRRTFNVLLDGLMADRARMRKLASLVIRAQDEERARIARELHDSTAQSLAALVLQLGAAERDCTDPALTGRLGEVRRLSGTVLEEVRSLSHTVHPRVLDDLGLAAALEWLARHSGEATGVRITVDVADEAAYLPPLVASTLYRVGQEALSNALRHANAQNVTLEVTTDGERARLLVADDGRGFDVAEAEARRAGMGLFSIQERVALVDGHLQVMSEPGAGTRVIATVPLVPPRQL